MLSRFADSSFAVFLLLVSLPALFFHLILFRQSWIFLQPMDHPTAGFGSLPPAHDQNPNCPGEDAIAAYEELIDSTLRGCAQ